MSSDRGSRPVRRGLLRSGLLLLAATPLFSGLWALILPRSFYDDFPLPSSDWVSTLGPYNEHLIRDYGALNLALTILLVAAALLLERRVVQVALVTWLVYATPHLVFHMDRPTISLPAPTWSNWADWGWWPCSRSCCSTSPCHSARRMLPGIPYAPILRPGHEHGEKVRLGHAERPIR